MATDTKPKKRFGNYARAAAIARFIKKTYGATTANSASRGSQGIRVTQDNAMSLVWLHVQLDDVEEAIEWAAEIEADLTKAGYDVQPVGSGGHFRVSKEEWRFDDQIGRLLFGFSGREFLERDGDMWTGMPEHVLRQLRVVALVEQDRLEFTELGAKVRARVITQKKRRDQAECRRIRSRGY